MPSPANICGSLSCIDYKMQSLCSRFLVRFTVFGCQISADVFKNWNTGTPIECMMKFTLQNVVSMLTVPCSLDCTGVSTAAEVSRNKKDT